MGDGTIRGGSPAAAAQLSCHQSLGKANVRSIIVSFFLHVVEPVH